MKYKPIWYSGERGERTLRNKCDKSKWIEFRKEINGDIKYGN